MALDLNDPELEFADLVTAYQSWVMAVINDEKLGGDPLLTDDIADDAINAMRFLPDVVTSAIETTLARVYDVDPEELDGLLYPRVTEPLTAPAALPPRRPRTTLRRRTVSLACCAAALLPQQRGCVPGRRRDRALPAHHPLHRRRPETVPISPRARAAEAVAHPAGA